MSRMIFGQVVPSAQSSPLTDLTTAEVPANRARIISNLQVCNQGTATTAIRIAMCDKDDTIDVKNYLVYDFPVGAKDSFYLNSGIILPTDWEIRIASSLANVSFQCWGKQIVSAGAEKVAQLAPSGSSTPSTLLTVTDTKEAVIGSLIACNRGSASDTVRIALRPDGATLDAKHYIFYDFVIPSYTSLEIASGIALGDNDIVGVCSAGGNVSFSAFYTEAGE